MTNREAYAMGWVYGYLYTLMGYPDELKKFPDGFDRDGTKFEAAGFNPFEGFALIHQEAMQRGVITAEATRVISEALYDVQPVEDGYRAPLPLVGSWQLGYYLALSGKPLPSGAPDIAALRKAKGLTQAQLAEMVGCDQAIISRWEHKQSTPSQEVQDKIMAVLS